MQKRKIKKNKGPASRRQANASRGGFVILFVVMVSSIILAITLSLANISLKEIKFSTSAKDTNDAFFAADTGAECALFYDKSTQNKFPLAGQATAIMCANVSVLPIFSSGVYSFIVTNLGSTGQSCAKVIVDKSISPAVIVSKGYNIGDVSCNSSNPSRVERQLELSY